MNFTAAAGSAGRKSGPAVSHLVARFNTESLDALHSRHGGGYGIKYTPEQRNRILEEVRLLAPHQHLRAWAASWPHTSTFGLGPPHTRSGTGRNQHLVVDHTATGFASTPRVRADQYLLDPRRAPYGWDRFTILAVLHEAGLSWQRNRTWCETGTAVRKRKQGSVVVTDPDCDAKKT